MYSRAIQWDFSPSSTHRLSSPFSPQIYWVGPIIGAVLAGALYEYVFCPDVELKRRLKEAFSKAAQQTKGSYMEVEDNRSQVETEDLILKPGLVHVIDIDRGEEKKGKDPSGEVLSSVWLEDSTESRRDSLELTSDVLPPIKETDLL